MEVKVTLNCEVKYVLIGFDELRGVYTPKEFEHVYGSLKGYNTEISHEIFESTTIDKDGIAILIVITIVNLDK